MRSGVQLHHQHCQLVSFETPSERVHVPRTHFLSTSQSGLESGLPANVSLMNTSAMASSVAIPSEPQAIHTEALGKEVLDYKLPD